MKRLEFEFYKETFEKESARLGASLAIRRAFSRLRPDILAGCRVEGQAKGLKN